MVELCPHPTPLSATGFPGGSVVKNLPVNVGDLGSIPGLGRSLGGRHGMVFLPGESTGTEEPSRLQFMRSQGVGHD